MAEQTLAPPPRFTVPSEEEEAGGDVEDADSGEEPGFFDGPPRIDEEPPLIIEEPAPVQLSWEELQKLRHQEILMEALRFGTDLSDPDLDPRLTNPKKMQIAFHSIAPKRPIPVPAHPAPPSHLSPREWRDRRPGPGRRWRPPKSKTLFERVLVSSLARCCTFSLTLVCFAVALFGFSEWKRPSRVLNGESPVLLASAVACTLIMFGCVPLLAHVTGMSSEETGWKPYLVIYRIAFLWAVPALVFMALGMGLRTGMGDAVGTPGSMVMQSLHGLDPGNYFEAADGFVALNMTKGVAETAMFTEHGDENQLRYSRYRDAELKTNYEPYTTEVEPTPAPGLLKLYVIAPIFTNWASCATRYRTSAQCINDNPVTAWALAKTDSFCTSLRSVACMPPDPLLRPVYKCSTAHIDGWGYNDEIQGLCGRTIQAPPDLVIDEYSALLINQGFPQWALPNSSQVWVNVWPDDCISHPSDCLNTYSIFAGIGLFFAATTACCILGACALDCYIDKRIRAARAWFLADQDAATHQSFSFA